ncbi:MAG: type II toxin-antitoxin system HipA family toxin [Alphaproteobacteria bacterium]|nr:type II toxin-antitoxin system HipA family toxin [Alphaproteobacteria bacterium]
MTDKIAFVYVDWEGNTFFVGRLFARNRKGRESSSFEYDSSWLTNPSRFALEPALTLHPAPFHTGQGRALFGSIGDSAPDRWGRTLMRRTHQRLAKTKGENPHTLQEIDFLLNVDDECRQGALRFSEKLEGAFLAQPVNGKRVPLLIDLPRLLVATTHAIKEEENDEEMRLLLAPGSSLGGARPKASVRSKEGELLIAKFPHPEDNIDLPAWESLALTLASKAGLRVTRHKLLKIAGRSVILLNRFDRIGVKRIPFISAMSLLEAGDNDPHSYLEVADALRRYSGNPQQDLIELWKRIVFSILVSNTDDHLRNHGLLLPNSDGWRLSPAYDINPTPLDIKPRRLSLAIDEEDDCASLELALSVSDRFGLSKESAKRIANEAGIAVAGWREQAKLLGMKDREADRMSSAFEHNDLRLALTL